MNAAPLAQRSEGAIGDDLAGAGYLWWNTPPPTLGKSLAKRLDNHPTRRYNTHMENPDPKSFAFRLRATIALLEAETQQGVEDWTSTIGRLKETLAEVENEESDNCAVAAVSDNWADDEDRRMEAESDDLSWEADEDRRMEAL
jgi:hypothetical protein